MLSSEALPNWPPPDNEPFGAERAREYIAWIREHAPPLIEEGRRLLQERHGAADTATSSVRERHFAEWKLGAGMNGLSVGVVYCSIQSGAWAMMNISIRRDGRLELKPGWNMG